MLCTAPAVRKGRYCILFCNNIYFNDARIHDDAVLPEAAGPCSRPLSPGSFCPLLHPCLRHERGSDRCLVEPPRRRRCGYCGKRSYRPRGRNEGIPRSKSTGHHGSAFRPSERERERERESLTYQTNTSNADSFSLISYIYRKIPEPGPNRFYRLSSLVAYPFSYPFFASQLLFPQEYTVVIENKNFSEKISLFSDVFLFVLRTELLLTMCPTWSAGVFFIYGHVLLSSVPDALPRIRAPPLAAPYSGQMPEASPGAALAVMRDAHVLNSSPTRLKRTFH